MLEQSSGILEAPREMEPGRSRLVVVLFTDLVGSTELKSEISTSRYVPLLRRHDELVRAAIAESGGAIQTDTGDGCLAIFATASEAVRAALGIQDRLHCEPWPDGRRLCARVGIHMGEVAETPVRQDGGLKIVGLAIDIGSRVMSLAQGGQTLLTRGAFDDARQFVQGHPAGESIPIKWVAHGPYRLKGVDEPVEIFEVGAQGQSPLTPPANSEKARRAVAPDEEQTLGWRPAVGLALPGSEMWVIVRKLGEGGFGEVWLAEHAKGKSVRVFKFCFDAHRLRALKREVVLFRLMREALGDRRDISKVIDWRLDESPYFIEMEYIAGGNLAEWAAARGGIGKVPLADRLRIVEQIATALSAAHSVGILHKDIKPSNVMMDENGDGSFHPVLTDFGIGILTDRQRLDQLKITADGFTVSQLTINDSSRTGTRMYAPPESLAGKPHTVQGDLYGLGVLLYQVVIADLDRPLGVGWEREVADPMLREEIAGCVDADPARRYSSAAEVAERLRTLPDRRRQRAEELARQEAMAQLLRRRKRRRAIGAVLGTIAAIVLTVGLLLHEISRQRQVAMLLRKNAQAQARLEQQTLAVQTAGGVQFFYSSILSDLELMDPSRSPPGSPATAPAADPAVSSEDPPLPGPGDPRNLIHMGTISAGTLSRQLQGRLSHLFIADSPGLGIRSEGIIPPDDAPTNAELADRLKGWLSGLKEPAIDPLVQFGDDGYSVVAVPYGSHQNLLLVAAVRAKQLQTLFLDKAAQHAGTEVFLLDSKLTVIAATRGELTGTNLGPSDPQLTAAISQAGTSGTGSTVAISHPFKIGTATHPPTLATLQPLRVGDQTWFVVIAAPLPSE